MARRHAGVRGAGGSGGGVPHGHWKTSAFIGALKLRGVIVPLVLDGPIKCDAFEACVEQVLTSELRPGEIVIVVNLSSHKGPSGRVLIEAAGAEIHYLPPYSPDFNPIEDAFAEPQALLGKAHRRGPLAAIGELLSTSSRLSAETTSLQPDTMQTDGFPL